MSNEKENIPTEHELSVTQQCDLQARYYGHRYLSELDDALTKQIRKIFGRNFTIEEFEMGVTREDRKGDHVKILDRVKLGGRHAGKRIERPTFFTLLKFRGTPIVEVEFSDTYYIKLLTLPKNGTPDQV